MIISQKDDEGIKKACEYAVTYSIQKKHAIATLKLPDDCDIFEEIRRIELNDLLYIHRVRRIFSIQEEQHDVIVALAQSYTNLLEEIVLILRDNRDKNHIKEMATAFLNLSKKESTRLIESLENYAVIR